MSSRRRSSDAKPPMFTLRKASASRKLLSTPESPARKNIAEYPRGSNLSQKPASQMSHREYAADSTLGSSWTSNASTGTPSERKCRERWRPM